MGYVTQKIYRNWIPLRRNNEYTRGGEQQSVKQLLDKLGIEGQYSWKNVLARDIV